MSLTFPRAMPLVGIGRQVFEPQQINFETAEAGGALYGVSAGVKRWRAEWTLAAALQDVQSDQWRAFLASLDGAKRTFLGRDWERPFPRLYKTGFGGMTRAAGGSFDGSVTSWSQTIAADGQALLTLGNVAGQVLPAALQLSMGDYVEFRWTTSGVDRRHMVRLLEDATASAGGVVSNVTVDPAVHNVVPGGAVAHLDNPACVMRLVTSQTQVTDMDRRRVAGAKIVALQDLRP